MDTNMWDKEILVTIISHNISSSSFTNFCEPFPKYALVFMCLQYKSYENTVGKEEIAHDKQLLILCKLFQF